MQDIILDKINGMLKSGEGIPTAEEVAHLEAAYPYFVLPAALRLARAEDIPDEEKKHLEVRVALASGDRESLFKLIDEKGRDFSGFYPPDDTPSEPTTDSAIDTFLETYGKADPHETALLEKLIFHPVAEYAATLIKEENENAPQGQDAVLDAFLKEFSPESKAKHEQEEARRKKAEAAKKQRPAADEDSLLSESLAKIYISRGKYDKAYEIIHSLSLNYPKKSIYFADQLRFLQKLMLNSKFKK